MTEQNRCFLKRQGCENRLDVSLRKKATQESNTLEPTVKRVGKELTLRNTAKPQAYNRKMHHHGKMLCIVSINSTLHITDTADRYNLSFSGISFFMR